MEETKELQVFEGVTIPDRLATRYSELPAELQDTSEDELRNKYRYSLVENQLRINLWKAVGESLRTGKKVKMGEVHEGVCSRNSFYKVINKDHKLAFMMLPVHRYEEKVETLLDVASSRYMDILSMDINSLKKRAVGMDEDGKVKYDMVKEVDPSKAKVLMDAIVNLENRVKGGAIQKNLTMHTEKPDGVDANSLDINAVKAKLKELDGKLKESNVDDPSVVIDVDYQEIKSE